MKPFWLSITDKEKLPQLDFLAAALLSRETSDEYRRALARALETPDSRVVPFFGVFVRDLKATLAQNPSIVVVSSCSDSAVPILKVSSSFDLHPNEANRCTGTHLTLIQLFWV